MLARAALGYADPGADLGIAYRTDDPVTAPLLERAIAAQATQDSTVTVQLEARLGAVLYFSDEPSRAQQLATSALDRARRLDDPGALATATALIHDAFVVGQVDLETQLAESARLLGWAQATGSVATLLTAHRARVFDLLAAGDIAGMDAEILAFLRLAEPLRTPGYLWWPALWSAMRALLEGRHDVAEERALAAFETGKRTFPSLSFFNLSFQLFFLRREQGRLHEMEQATREYAASRADIPALRVALTFLLAELGRRRRSPRHPRDVRRTGTAATPRPELADVVVPARPGRHDSRRRADGGDVARTTSPPDRAVHPGLARHGVPRSRRSRDCLAAAHDRRCEWRRSSLPAGGGRQRAHRCTLLARSGSR